MPSIVSVIVALLLAAGLIFGAHYYFNRIQRRRRWLGIGTEVLASRSWKDGLDLLTKALIAEGGTAEGLVGDKGVPLAERLLQRADGRTLLIYKHGTAYRIAAPALAEAQRRREEVEADALCIATLGSIDPAAIKQAERDGIRVLGGDAVWTLVEPLMEERVRNEVAREADEAVKRPRTLATAAALLGAAIVVFHLPQSESAPTTVATARPAVASTPAAPAPAAETATENTEPAQREARRAALASAMIDIRGVAAASWSSNTTLVVELLPESTIDGVFTASCSLAAQYPELRDEVRLQFESADPAEGVRWRRCS